MKIKLKQRVHDTVEDKILEAGTIVERDAKRGKDFLKYGEEVKEDEGTSKPKKKRSKKE